MGHDARFTILVVCRNDRDREILGVGGGVWNVFLWAGPGESWLSSLFRGNYHPIIFMPKRCEHFGGSEELPQLDSASLITAQHGAVLCCSLHAHGSFRAQQPMRQPLDGSGLVSYETDPIVNSQPVRIRIKQQT